MKDENTRKLQPNLGHPIFAQEMESLHIVEELRQEEWGRVIHENQEKMEVSTAVQAPSQMLRAILPFRKLTLTVGT